MPHPNKTTTDSEGEVAMGVPIGEDERAPEDDLSGLYDGYLAEFKVIDKPEWKIESEITKYGKDPDKVDHKQYEWVFAIEDPTWVGPETITAWTGRTWGSKSNAYLYGSTLLNGPVTAGMDSDVLLHKRCRVSVAYSEKGRNYIDGIKPPKKAGSAPVQESTSFLSSSQATSYGPHAFTAATKTGPCDVCGEGALSLIHASQAAAPQAPLMAGASEDAD